MATVPTLGLTFEDLILRVAEYLGLADYSDGAAAIPTDAHDLDVCQRIVNDGWRMFTGAYHRWNWLTPICEVTFAAYVGGVAESGTATTLVDGDRTEASDYFNGYTIRITGGTGAGEYATVTDYDQATGTFTFTALSGGSTPDSTSKYEVAPPQCVNGDNSRYYMPDGFYGQMVSFFTYPNEGSRIRLEEVDEATIRSMYAGTGNSSGDPCFAAIRPLPLPSDLGQFNRRWELLIYPRPSQVYTITGRCRVWMDKMINNDDRHAAGFQHDEAVLAAALAKAELYRNDYKPGPMDTQYKQAIIESIRIDSATTPKSLGYNGSQDSVVDMLKTRSYTGVDTYTSADGTVHRFV